MLCHANVQKVLFLFSEYSQHDENLFYFYLFVLTKWVYFPFHLEISVLTPIEKSSHGISL